MKKSFLFMGVAAIAAFGFTSCSDDDDKIITEPDPVPVSRGVCILNQGNQSNKIEGELNVIDLADNSISRSVFYTVNVRYLGSTPQCGITYGGKIYLGMHESKTIEILDAVTYRSIKQIKLADSDLPGTQPRSMVTDGGKVYISMYEGYVARLDTLSLDIDASVKVGPNPEIIGIHKGKIYVPNSDGMSYPDYGTTASVIDIASFTVTSTLENIPMNPKQFISCGGELFLISLGNYSDIPNSIYKVNDMTGESTKITDATLVAEKDNILYIVDAPYGGKSSYCKYDVRSGALTPMSFDQVEAPNGIGVDPVTGEIIISSYKDPNAYSDPGYVYQYDSNGKFVKKYDCGVGAPAIFFNVSGL